MRQLVAKEINQVVSDIVRLDSTLKDIGFGDNNEFRAYLRVKLDNLHTLLKAIPIPKPKPKEIPSPQWYDYKLEQYIEVKDMHTYHILNARKKMEESYANNASYWVKVFTEELERRKTILVHQDGAPNLISKRVLKTI